MVTLNVYVSAVPSEQKGRKLPCKGLESEGKVRKLVSIDNSLNFVFLI